MSKKYELNGKRYEINAGSLKWHFDLFKEKNRLTVTELEIMIGEYVGYSPSAVHSWLYNKERDIPDIERIKLVADFFGFDYMCLLKECVEKMSDSTIKKTTLTSDREKEALRRVYCAIMDFLYWFEKTDGFVSLIHEEYGDGSCIDGTLKAYDAHDELYHILEREYIDLGKTNIYDELYDYIYNDLFEIFDEKMDPAYRYEPDSGVKVCEDYEKAYTKLIEIIEKYI